MTSKAPHTFLEPLESRIAPARIILAGSPNPNDIDTNYNDSDPVQQDWVIDTELGGDAISLALGNGVAGAADTHYLRMSAGDKLILYTQSGGFNNDVITVKSGNIIVFLVDQLVNGVRDNEIQASEIKGIALGANANVDIKTVIAGDIVSVLDEKGTKALTDDTLSFTTQGGPAGLVSAKQNLAGLSVGSSVGGSVVVGGNINNIRITGTVSNILAGTAGNGYAFDFYPGVNGGEGVVEWTAGDGATDDVKQGIVGSSITKVNIDNVVGRIQAGDGGAGAKGGSITNVVFTDDSDGLNVIAGAGGASNAAKPNGGAGGFVKQIYVSGVPDSSSNDLIHIVGGKGGNSTVGAGGAGGAANLIFIGYDLNGGKTVPSSALTRDNVEIFSGVGGDGKVGGAGGLTSKIDVRVSTPDDTNNVNASEIFVAAGNGGAGGLGGTVGRAGLGGSITDVALRNEEPAGATFSDTLMQAGNAGASTPASLGAAGGSITRAFLRGFDLAGHAGNGSSGKIGGNGGSVTSITVEQGSSVLARSGDFSAGHGGDGAVGNGGKGGSMTTFSMTNSDLSGFSAVAGNGGSATGLKGKGGIGGSITNYTVLDIDFDFTVTGNFVLHSGNGGNGAVGGGAGGNLTTLSFGAINMNADVASGNGGNGTGAGNGKGGNGGAISKVNITAFGDVGGVDAVGTVVSGNGGNGAGTKGAGGAAGSISFMNLNVHGSASLTSGTGGNGTNAAPGNGGDVKSTLVFAETGTGELLAGNGGALGNAPARGGSIFGVNSSFLSGLFAAKSLTMKAGDGTHGGAGGSLKFIGFGSTSSTLTPTPVGTIDILAGNGSAEGKSAGAGGSISEIQGAVASATLAEPGPFNTTILGGDVIAQVGATKSAAGGSIVNLDLRRGGNANGVLLIEAGDANDTQVGTTGAKGGDVKGVAVAEIDPGTIFRGVAAGDGGDATKKGGLGGSIFDVKVTDHDIGVRSGQTYGYSTMGGLFAGVGGSGQTSGKNGSVTNVAAQMIASIVAGRGAAPKMAEKVAQIYVGTPTDLLRDSELDINVVEAAGDPNYAAYTLASYTTNTFVGATVNPIAVDGNKFKWTDDGDGIYEDGEVPIDGLVASVIFDQKTVNFTPEARVTAGVLYDFDNKY